MSHLELLDPQAWRADILGRIADRPAQKIDELLPWKWNAVRNTQAAAA